MNAEKAVKWGVAIVVIFGILNAFYLFKIVVALKITLPVLCIFLIGSILLQSGKGGGLAAIGGLGDQSAFGTKTGTFLSKITYLLGAAFIVTTVLLFKLSVPVSPLKTITTHEVPLSQHTHEHEPSAHESGYGHGDVHQDEKVDATDNLGMQSVEEKKSDKSVHGESQSHGVQKNGTIQDQPVGMKPVESESQSTSKTEKSKDAE
ncbi:MAG TPA: preprotein translocase subunit SecG [Candidatus Wujingus californicus]|uniref:preprotein translocase subunit SecG n=2 Tax=Candidatus Wujingus californicus TaxID=3367618 RepID=UPI001D87BCDB|nr:preprotein translocase subunit SecG [Planctomycetota bacterium]MDO8131709.1 preprotein translocase subunit SecG [Candidatus Brocadiales bacterium]